MARYKALARGFDGRCIREEGDEFEFDGKPGKWMKLLSGDPVKDAPVNDFEATTKKDILAELADLGVLANPRDPKQFLYDLLQTEKAKKK